MHPAKPAPGCLVLALVASLAAGCGVAHPRPVPYAAGPGAAVTVQASISHCGLGWTPSGAGHQHLVVHNTDTRPGEVLLSDARTGAVYAYLEPLAAGSSANLEVDLGGGSYRFRCAMEDEDVVDGPIVAVTGTAAANTPGVIPVTQADLIAPTKQYEQYVRSQLPELDRLTDILVADVSQGQLPAARRDWLPAHLAYERLGAAYGAFGAVDTAINGTTEGRPGGPSDPGFTGFHRLEYGLWHGRSAASLTPIAKKLRQAVRSLTSVFAAAQIDPGDVATRAHEITENAIEFELTATTDYGSHSNLATVAAKLAGTRTVLDLLKPLLIPRYPALARAYASLTAAQRAVPVGTSLAQLSRSDREQLDARLGELVELLAPVAEICEPRRTS